MRWEETEEKEKKSSRGDAIEKRKENITEEKDQTREGY